MIHWHYLAWVIAAGCFLFGLLGYFAAGMASRATTRDDYRFPNWLMITAVLLVALTLAACGGRSALPPPEPIIRTVEVQVPVDDPACARAAMEELGTAPAYPDTDDALALAAGLFERVKLLLAGRELRQAREAVLIGAIAECAN